MASKLKKSNIANQIAKFRVFESDHDINVLSQGSIFSKAGKWFIPAGDYPSFLSYVTDEITECKDIYELHFLERPHMKHNYIKFDLDMRFDASEAEKQDSSKIVRRYDTDFIIHFVRTLASLLQKLLTLDATAYTIYVQEKRTPKYTKDHQIKDGIHIVIPDIVLPNRILNHIRTELIADPKIMRYFNEIKIANPLEEVIDYRIIEHNAWFVYGCGKPEDHRDYYTVTNKFGVTFNGHKITVADLTEDDDMTPLLEYITLFSNFNKVPSDGIKLRAAIALDEASKLEGKLTSADRKRIRSEFNNMGLLNIRRHCAMHGNEIGTIMGCLNQSRCDTFTDWWAIGLSLYNMDDRNFGIWDEWSRKSAKYDKDDCFRRWYFEFPRCGKYSMGIFTLKNYARIDNKERFDEINRIMVLQYMQRWTIEHTREYYMKDELSIDTFSNHVKMYISDYAKYKTVCADPSAHGLWYKFKHNKWSVDKASHEIYMTLTDELKSNFLRLRQKLNKDKEDMEVQLDSKPKVADSDDGSGVGGCDDRVANDEVINNTGPTQKLKEVNELNNQIKKINDILNFLSAVHTKDKIIKDLSQKCYDEDFIKNINENRDVFVCQNGALDLEQCMFRKGVPSDMSTISCGVAYPDELTYSNTMMDIQDYLDKIFPDQEIQDYMLNIISEKLSGRVRREMFIICTGSGANGKSQFFKLIQATFGEYYGTFDNSLLNTPKKDANSASPAIASLKGIRLAFTSEPKNNLPFETDKLKELIGGDELVGRQLRQDLIRFIPQYLMGMMCNDIPEMPSTDDGVWRKIYVLPFVSKFVVKEEDLFKLGNAAWPNHFRAEEKEHLYKEWAPFLLHMLFERYKQLAEMNFKYAIPDKVREATRKYQLESNIFSQFFTERIVAKADYRLALSELFTAFRGFCEDSGHKINGISKKVFNTQMERFLGKSVRGEYYEGFIVKSSVSKVTNIIDEIDATDEAANPVMQITTAADTT